MSLKDAAERVLGRGRNAPTVTPEASLRGILRGTCQGTGLDPETFRRIIDADDLRDTWWDLSHLKPCEPTPRASVFTRRTHRSRPLAQLRRLGCSATPACTSGRIDWRRRGYRFVRR